MFHNYSMKIEKYKCALCIVAVFALIVNITMKHVCENTAFFLLINLIWGFSVSLLIGFDIVNLNVSTSTKWIVALGYILRLCLIFLVISGMMKTEGSDQLGFWQTAYDYYQGDFSFKYTNYPYVINGIMQFFGPFQFMPRLFNVILWYLGFRVIYCLAGLQLFGKWNQLVVLFYSLMPMQLDLTSGLLRESIIAFSLMLATYFLIRWMEKNGIFYLLLSFVMGLPAIIMHTGNIAIWGAIFLTVVLWNQREKSWDLFSWKAAGLVLLIIFATPVYEILVSVLPFSRLPRTLSLDALTENSTWVVSRANYISGPVEIHTIPQMILYTLYRMFYFWVSPTPRFWSAPIDIVGFLLDTVPWLLFFAVYIHETKKNRYGWAGALLFLVFTFIYGWGTSNAGTAMRHRDEMIGPLSMYLVYMMNNNREPIT